MPSPDQNKANVKAFYDLAFNQRQPEGFVKWITGENPDLRVEFKRFIAESDRRQLGGFFRF
jgi:hypothetical protein